MNYYKVSYFKEAEDGISNFYSSEDTFLYGDQMFKTSFYAYKDEEGFHDFITGELIKPIHEYGNKGIRLYFNFVEKLNRKEDLEDYKKSLVAISTNGKLLNAYMIELEMVAYDTCNYANEIDSTERILK